MLCWEFRWLQEEGWELPMLAVGDLGACCREEEVLVEMAAWGDRRVLLDAAADGEEVAGCGRVEVVDDDEVGAAAGNGEEARGGDAVLEAVVAPCADGAECDGVGASAEDRGDCGGPDAVDVVAAAIDATGIAAIATAEAAG